PKIVIPESRSSSRVRGPRRMRFWLSCTPTIPTYRCATRLASHVDILARVLPPAPSQRNAFIPCDSVAEVPGRRRRWRNGWHENCRRWTWHGNSPRCRWLTSLCRNALDARSWCCECLRPCRGRGRIRGRGAHLCFHVDDADHARMNIAPVGKIADLVERE